jgi:hypothetical protein
VKRRRRRRKERVDLEHITKNTLLIIIYIWLSDRKYDGFLFLDEIIFEERFFNLYS